ncbi:MAG: small conductance mechanosensitive channel [Glaciecola sp.]
MLLLATSTPAVTPTPPALDLTDPRSIADVLGDSVAEIRDAFVEHLPLYVLALIVFVLGVIVVRQMMKGLDRGMARARVDASVQTLTHQLLRAALLFGLLLIALSVAGIEVKAALATLGLAGLALAFALQNILENFIAGILILIRRPFKIGDLVIAHDYEGTVQDINLRVTRLHTVDGEVHLVPNAHVFSNPITNLSELGARRTAVTVGVDYRDDHTAVPGLLQPVVAGLEGILTLPAPDVMLLELADSSVNFRIRFWTLPDNATVVETSALVLSAVKSTLQEAGMTIPWPIRTLANDDYRTKA